MECVRTSFMQRYCTPFGVPDIALDGTHDGIDARWNLDVTPEIRHHYGVPANAAESYARVKERTANL